MQRKVCTEKRVFSWTLFKPKKFQRFWQWKLGKIDTNLP